MDYKNSRSHNSRDMLAVFNSQAAREQLEEVIATYAQEISATYHMSPQRASDLLYDLINNMSENMEELDKRINQSVNAQASAVATGEKREVRSYESTDEHYKAALNTTFQHLTGRTQVLAPALGDGTGGAMTTSYNDAPSAETLDSGIAAGDVYERFGVWVQAVGAVGKQKARKGASGFASSLVGGIIGVDTLISDKILVGLAVSNMVNNVKHKDIQTGDKSNSSSLVLSVYGHQQMEDNWFIRGGLAYTDTAVNNKDIRIGSSGRKGIAQAKYNIYSMGTDFAVGKSFTAGSGITAIPSAGIRVTYTHKISYKETGNTGLNHKVFQKATNAMQAGAGIMVMKIFEKEAVLLTPEAHVNFQYGIGVKAPKGKYTDPAGSKLVYYMGSKPARISSNIGFGLTLESGSIEYGMGYDANISAGYLAHQGSIKLKVMF